MARPESAKELRLQQAKSTTTGWHALSLRRACGPTEVVIDQHELVPSHHAPGPPGPGFTTSKGVAKQGQTPHDDTKIEARMARPSGNLRHTINGLLEASYIGRVLP